MPADLSPLTEARDAWKLFLAASANITRLEGYARRNEAMARDLAAAHKAKRDARQQLDALLLGVKAVA